MFGGVSAQLDRLLTGTRRRVYPIDVLVRAANEFMEDGGSIYAAAMSYYVLFSLFPAMIFLVTIFGFIVQDEQIREQVVNRVVAEIPQGFDVRPQVEAVIENVAQTSGLLSLLSLLGTAWTGSIIFGALRQALNTAFDVPSARPFLLDRLFDILTLFGLAVLILISVAITAAFQVARRLTAEVVDGFLVALAWDFGTLILPLIISFFIFMIVYRVIPNIRASFRDIWVGAMIAAAGFELAKIGFAIYVANFGRYQEIYGTLGGVVAFLFLVFLVANIVIFAAEVISELTKDRIAREHRMRELPRAGAVIVDRAAHGG